MSKEREEQPRLSKREQFLKIIRRYAPRVLIGTILSAIGTGTVSAQENKVEDGRPGNISFTTATGETPNYGVGGEFLNPYLGEQSATNPETVTLQESQEIASMGTIEIDFRTLNPDLLNQQLAENPNLEISFEVENGSVLVTVENDNGETTQRVLSLSDNPLESFLNQVATTLGDATVTVRLRQMENGKYTVTAVSDNESEHITFFYITETGKTTAITAESLSDGQEPHFHVLPTEALPSNALVEPLEEVDGRNFILVTTSLQPGPESSATEVPAQIIANNGVTAEVAATLYTASGVTNFRTAPIVNPDTFVNSLNTGETLPLLNPINTNLEALKSILSSKAGITQEMLDAITISQNGLSFELNFGGHNWYIAYDNTTNQVVFITGTQSSLSATPVPEAVVFTNPEVGSTPPAQLNVVEQPTAPAIVAVPAEVPPVVEEEAQEVRRIGVAPTENSNVPLRSLSVEVITDLNLHQNGTKINDNVDVRVSVTVEIFTTTGVRQEVEVPLIYAVKSSLYPDKIVFVSATGNYLPVPATSDLNAYAEALFINNTEQRINVYRLPSGPGVTLSLGVGENYNAISSLDTVAFFEAIPEFNSILKGISASSTSAYATTADVSALLITATNGDQFFIPSTIIP